VLSNADGITHAASPGDSHALTWTRGRDPIGAFVGTVNPCIQISGL